MSADDTTMEELIQAKQLQTEKEKEIQLEKDRLKEVLAEMKQEAVDHKLRRKYKNNYLSREERLKRQMATSQWHQQQQTTPQWQRSGGGKGGKGGRIDGKGVGWQGWAADLSREQDEVQ